MIMKFITSFAQRLAWLATIAAMKIFCNFYREGMEKLRGISGPLLIVSNHRSYWDSFIIGTLFPFSSKLFPLSFIAAEMFFKNPFSRLIMKVLGASPAIRGKGLDISLKDLRAALADNRAAVIFPYGKRIYDDSERPGIGRGAAALVSEFKNLTILPVYLKTTPGLSLFKFLFGKKEMGAIAGNPYTINLEHKTHEEISAILVQSFLALGHAETAKQSAVLN